MKRSKRKSLALIMCAILLVGASVLGTMAYLTDTTEEVTNTFTIGKVDIELEETTGETYEMTPGSELEKDPVATVVAGSEDCWLFVKVTENNLTDYISYDIADGWNKLEDGVYYREVSNSNADQDFPVLKDNKVTVSDDVEGIEGTAPTLSFTAYAIQKTNIATAADAWAEFE